MDKLNMIGWALYGVNRKRMELNNRMHELCEEPVPDPEADGEREYCHLCERLAWLDQQENELLKTELEERMLRHNMARKEDIIACT